MPPKPKVQAKSGAVTRSATAAKGSNTIKTVTSAGKGKTSHVETKIKGQSSKVRKPLLNLAVKKGRIMLRRTNLRLQLRRLRMSWMSRTLNVRLSE